MSLSSIFWVSVFVVSDAPSVSLLYHIHFHLPLQPCDLVAHTITWCDILCMGENAVQRQSPYKATHRSRSFVVLASKRRHSQEG
ncbi:hypothetical protein PENSPDRAFT_376451 [Peniophora sp. CONT]|nr:hypothetical protein PENSPDRAFT_376451 [Peniophora sp. CONT]